ncbi:MAG: hypothetical protein NT059_11930 [Planctomycetota bacterium]|nr:hypothetical protein [Planctomycetota bacterium]
MLRAFTFFAVPAAILTVSGSALGAVSTVKFTADALGLGSSNINEGSTAEANIAGKLITSSTTGMGSSLYVQRSGLAGSGTASDPLMLRVTCRTRLDAVSGFPGSNGTPNDYQAGVLYVAKENSSTVGKDEGLGVRAFETDTSGIRKTSGGVAKITGNKEMSGGTGSTVFDPTPSDEPGDEEILVEFNGASSTPGMLGDSMTVTLSKFKSGNLLELTINLQGGGVLQFASLGTSSGAFTSLGSDVQRLAFSSLAGLSSSAIVSSFAIRAIEDNASHPSVHAEGLLLQGISGTLVPAPGAIALLGVAGIVARRRRR